mmetsp:Transcript_18107/g.45594  ORF Transcript_18107/g.45594 Transcript_18107/m.45594 type:complete len:242 (-) Transcript_18107:366-1091(-)
MAVRPLTDLTMPTNALPSLSAMPVSSMARPTPNAAPMQMNTVQSMQPRACAPLMHPVAIMSDPVRMAAVHRLMSGRSRKDSRICVDTMATPRPSASHMRLVLSGALLATSDTSANALDSAWCVRKCAPVSSSSTSPTTTSVLFTSTCAPPRTTLTWMASRCALSLRNWRSFCQSLPAPTQMTMMTAIQMATPSTHPFFSRSSGMAAPSVVDTAAATMSRMMMGSCAVSYASLKKFLGGTSL